LTDELPRRGEHGEITVLPPDGCTRTAPAWPDGKPSVRESAIWKHLWGLPVAAWWWEQRTSPEVIARYVALRVNRPEHAATSQLERELGLTPASMKRAGLVVGVVPIEEPLADNPYIDLMSEMGVDRA